MCPQGHQVKSFVRPLPYPLFFVLLHVVPLKEHKWCACSTLIVKAKTHKQEYAPAGFCEMNKEATCLLPFGYLAAAATDCDASKPLFNIPFTLLALIPHHCNCVVVADANLMKMLRPSRPMITSQQHCDCLLLLLLHQQLLHRFHYLENPSWP